MGTTPEVIKHGEIMYTIPALPPVVRRAQEITIETAEDYEEAQHALRWIAEQKKKFLGWFEPHCKRAYDGWKALVADRDTRVGPADEARKILEAKMNVFEAAREQARIEAQKQLEAANPGQPVVVVDELPAVHGVSASRPNYKFRVVNAALIPRDLCIPDDKAIGKIVKALGEKANIPGVEVYSEKVRTVRG